MRRPEMVLEIGDRRATHRDRGGKARRIHLLHRRRIAEIGRNARELLDIGGERARIAVEILACGKLCRIDEDRDHHAIGAPARLLHQSEMAPMQRAHCGNEADALAARAPLRDALAQLGQRMDGGNGKSAHLRLILCCALGAWLSRKAI
jgi:hypothetical protein